MDKLSADELAAAIAALPDWPDVAKGNYPSWDGGYRAAHLLAASKRLALAVQWMKGRIPCATGQCCHELRAVIAACEEPSDV